MVFIFRKISFFSFGIVLEDIFLYQSNNADPIIFNKWNASTPNLLSFSWSLYEFEKLCGIFFKLHKSWIFYKKGKNKSVLKVNKEFKRKGKSEKNVYFLKNGECCWWWLYMKLLHAVCTEHPKIFVILEVLHLVDRFDCRHVEIESVYQGIFSKNKAIIEHFSQFDTV